MVKEVFIIGAGMGVQNALSSCVIEKIESAELVLATKRLYDNLSHLNSNFICIEISEMYDKLCESKLQTAVVLASGDVGFYSIAKSLKQKLLAVGIKTVHMISGVSSLQYLTAKLGIGYDDIKLVSLHGRDTNPIPHVCYNRRVFFLVGGIQTVDTVISKLFNAGLTDVTVTIGENLSDISEIIITDKIQNLIGKDFSQLSVMIVENEGFVNHNEKIYDCELIRGKAPMTKEAVRTLSLSYLEIQPTDTVLDIGAGTGSCSIEIARKAYQGTVYAIERDEQAVLLIRENIEQFGAFNVDVIEGTAPDNLPQISIDKAFIGGSGGQLDSIIKVLLEKNPLIRVVVNAITLETLNEAVTVFNRYNCNPIITCINVSVSEKIGRYNMMKAQNPIYIISGSFANEVVQ